jgi:hypothetical protein
MVAGRQNNATDFLVSVSTIIDAALIELIDGAFCV